MTQVLDSCTSPETWSARYEQLRADWLAGETSWGQALFIRQGAATWMKAWSAAEPCATTRRSECSASETDVSQPVAANGELQRQLAHELVNLILHSQQEVMA